MCPLIFSDFFFYLPWCQMSYPSGFSRLRIRDRSTQRMAVGEGDLGSNMNDEGKPSSSARVDAIGVIMWLRLV